MIPIAATQLQQIELLPMTARSKSRRAATVIALVDSARASTEDLTSEFVVTVRGKGLTKNVSLSCSFSYWTNYIDIAAVLSRYVSEMRPSNSPLKPQEQQDQQDLHNTGRMS